MIFLIYLLVANRLRIYRISTPSGTTFGTMIYLTISVVNAYSTYSNKSMCILVEVVPKQILVLFLIVTRTINTKECMFPSLASETFIVQR